MPESLRPVVCNNSIGALNLLGIVFVVLKLCGDHFPTPVAQWSWWLVTLPFWFLLGIAGAALLVAVSGAAIMFLVCETGDAVQKLWRRLKPRK